MKQVCKFFSPIISIVVGAVLVLCSIVCFYTAAEVLAFGIIACIFGLTYIGIGTFEIFVPYNKNEMLNKVFDILKVVLIPLLLTFEGIISFINFYNLMIATGWIIELVALISFFGLSVVYIVSKFVNVSALNKVVALLSILSILSIILSFVFVTSGGENIIGDISIARLTIAIFYCLLLIKTVFLKGVSDCKINDNNQEDTEEIEEN